MKLDSTFAILLLMTPAVLAASKSQNTPPPTSLQYRDELIRNARAEWGISAPVADFAAQLQQESGWRVDAKSPTGAVGMAQFMPATADWVSHLIPELSVNKPFNPSWAIRALVSYDNWLMQRIKAVDSCQKMAFTLSAYNGGLGWINRDKKLATRQGLNPQYWFGQVETVNAGRSQSNWKENRHYPKNILYSIAPRYLSWGSGSCIQ